MEANFTEALTRYIDSINELRSLKTEFSNMQSFCDKTIVDIYHEVEFSNYNVCDGYKSYKKLQETLRRRRLAKDGLEVLSTLPLPLNPDELISSTIDKLDKRRYTERVGKPLSGENYEVYHEGSPIDTSTLYAFENLDELTRFVLSHCITCKNVSYTEGSIKTMKKKLDSAAVTNREAYGLKLTMKDSFIIAAVSSKECYVK